MVHVSYCCIGINNSLLAVKFYSSLVVSGLSKNEFNSCTLFNFYCYFTSFYLVLRWGGELCFVFILFFLFSFVRFNVNFKFDYFKILLVIYF